ncbi:MAG: hypothetical protein JNN15_15165 [Blastocatellia bacterium]|nr:hypothetical protein [Blastocatellia bacterium]
MASIFIVRSTGGEVEACCLGDLKVLYVFEERTQAQNYCSRLNTTGRLHKVEGIEEAEFCEYIIPCLRKSNVDALIFNFIPGEQPGPETFSVDINQPRNPRTYDFKSGKWLTAKDAHRCRRFR